jgi:hypothetical protein
MAKWVRRDDAESAALPTLSCVLGGLARRGVVEAFLLNTSNGPELRIGRGPTPLDARRLRGSPIGRSSPYGHVRNSRNASSYGNPTYSGFAATGSGNYAAVVARRNETGMLWYCQRVVCFLSDSEGSVC